MGFPHNTFVVADVPPAVEQHVRDIRRRYGSARQYLPVAVTLAGSSGVGVFAAEQDEDAALRTVSAIADAVPPFPLAFGAVARFPNSGVFYYPIREPAPLVTLHERLRDSGLRFESNPYPFSPHLTVDEFDDADEALAVELLALPAPAGEFRVESLTVYALHGWMCRAVAKHPLGG